jgi:hypothetical protein
MYDGEVTVYMGFGWRSCGAGVFFLEIMSCRPTNNSMFGKGSRNQHDRLLGGGSVVGLAVSRILRLFEGGMWWCYMWCRHGHQKHTSHR